MITSALVNGVLMVAMENGSGKERTAERKGQVAQVKDAETDQVYGYNFFGLGLKGQGAVDLDEDQVKTLNDLIDEAGFSPVLDADFRPKFVVGYVQECKPMEDSDHLNITQTEIDQGEVVQIVCGAPNVDQGQKVVVAKRGAIMPSGMVIWPGELRGATSNGMICSARELDLKDASKKRGILVLDDDARTGEAFQA